MCLILIAVRKRPDFPLVIAANRDEYFRRPTRRAEYWEDAPDVLGGRDLEAGGSWMGVDRNGRLAAVTNVREPPRKKTGMVSRGFLVSDYLKGDEEPTSYLERVISRRHRFDTFNLLVGRLTDLYFFTSLQADYRRLDSGIYGISNGDLDCPWPKVNKGKAALKEALHSVNGPDMEDLFGILADKAVADDAELPDTGVGPEVERRLSPIFVHMSGYGTRSSTIVTIDNRGKMTFAERYFEENAAEAATNRFEIELSVT